MNSQVPFVTIVLSFIASLEAYGGSYGPGIYEVVGGPGLGNCNRQTEAINKIMSNLMQCLKSAPDDILGGARPYNGGIGVPGDAASGAAAAVSEAANNFCVIHKKQCVAGSSSSCASLAVDCASMRSLRLNLANAAVIAAGGPAYPVSGQLPRTQGLGR